MNEKSPLTKKILEARQQDRLAVMPFLPAGFPGKEQFWEELKALDAAGADVIEIGVPFSDPVADGPTVEQASLECLEREICLEWIFNGLDEHRGDISAELVLMGYYNPFLQYGLYRLAQDAARVGVAGFIVPDLPFEEAEDMRMILSAPGLDLIPLVGLNTSTERMKMYAEVATGFVYFVSVLGITGARDSLPRELKKRLAAAREIFDLPLALGFGLSSPGQLDELKGLVDAVVIGSALIKHIRGGGGSAEFLAPWTGREEILREVSG